MSYRSYSQSIIVFVVTCGVVCGAAWITPRTFSSPQTVNNANTKTSKNPAVSPANKNQSAAPARSTTPAKQGSTNKTTQQQQTPGKSTSPSAPPNNKMNPVEKPATNKLPHQYVVASADTGTPHIIGVNVENRGKGSAAAGTVFAYVAYLENTADAQKSKVLGWPEYMDLSGNFGRYSGTQKLPALKPGENVWVSVELYISKSQYIFLSQLKNKLQQSNDTRRLGIVVQAGNGSAMANGKAGAELHDFISAGFFKE